MTSYSESQTYVPINVWDVYTRVNAAAPWELLRTVDVDETAFVVAENQRAGWQAYAISRRTVSVSEHDNPPDDTDPYWSQYEEMI